MAYRLPTPLPSVARPTSGKPRQSTPWRGVLCVTGMRASDKDSSQDLHVSAVETDGDRYASIYDGYFPVRTDAHTKAAWISGHLNSSFASCTVIAS